MPSAAGSEIVVKKMPLTGWRERSRLMLVAPSVVGVDCGQPVVEQEVARVRGLEVQRVVQREGAGVAPVTVEAVLLQHAAGAADLEQGRAGLHRRLRRDPSRLAGDHRGLAAGAGVAGVV